MKMVLDMFITLTQLSRATGKEYSSVQAKAGVIILLSPYPRSLQQYQSGVNYNHKSN